MIIKNLKGNLLNGSRFLLLNITTKSVPRLFHLKPLYMGLNVIWNTGTVEQNI